MRLACRHTLFCVRESGGGDATLAAKFIFAEAEAPMRAKKAIPLIAYTVGSHASAPRHDREQKHGGLAIVKTGIAPATLTILLEQEARNRKTPEEKIAIIQQTIELGMNVSYVARLHCIQYSPLFKWKKQYQEGSLVAGADVVPASELAAALKQVREFQRFLGNKDDGS